MKLRDSKRQVLVQHMTTFRHNYNKPNYVQTPKRATHTDTAALNSVHYIIYTPCGLVPQSPCSSMAEVLLIDPN